MLEDQVLTHCAAQCTMRLAIHCNAALLLHANSGSASSSWPPCAFQPLIHSPSHTGALPG